ncbi:hypothetical protein L6164_001014 [Bauhinia variegata]|uniref:Uncharacterized protein n=1 Tax=Bauhinia variegata TaxID=167791 RepID=A0ACB9Q9L8_BAUVA|nr:hypothetical protein L6164_001014 [Bauhinia variegata]
MREIEKGFCCFWCSGFRFLGGVLLSGILYEFPLFFVSFNANLENVLLCDFLCSRVQMLHLWFIGLKFSPFRQPPCDNSVATEFTFECTSKTSAVFTFLI